MVGCWMWCPLTNVVPSACRGVTVQTPSCIDIRQWRAWIEGPNSCRALVLAEPTSIGSLPSLTRRPPSPLCVISMSIGPSRSPPMLLPPFDTPRGFFFRLRGCESAGRRRT
uniref:Putative secreted protein n=1 Tax=Anopheles darlingi TaxID=43151 RepID=A0A2M4DGE9_ANODA